MVNIDNKKVWKVTRSKDRPKYFGDAQIMRRNMTREEARAFAKELCKKEQKRQFNKTYPSNQIRSITICNQI